MVKTKKDLTGWNMWEHGVLDSRLTVIEQTDDYISPNGVHHARWLCECSCEEHNRIKATGTSLKNGHVKSCGCLQKEHVSISDKNKKPINTYDLSGEYGIGYTKHGEEFWFDLEDYDLIKDYSWHYYNSYVVAREKGTGKTIKLHRLVMGITDPNIKVDHKKHPPRRELKKDNRKSNLRIVTQTENQMNRAPQLNNISGVPGVSWDSSRNKWQVHITVNKKPKFLGRFKDKEDAIKARKDAELKYFGEYRYDANNYKEAN